MQVQDAYGASMPRDKACIDPTASIVIKIVDACVSFVHFAAACGRATHE